MTLNGWQRLWLVVVAVWGICVLTFAVMLWPTSIYHAPNGYSEEVVSQMQVRDWKGKNGCAPGWTPVQPNDTISLQIAPDNLTVSYVVRQAFPGTYDDLTDQQLEDAVRSKAPDLDRIVRKMIEAHEPVDNVVLVLRHASESRVKGAEQIQPVFAQVEIEMGAGKDNPVLCFAGEPKDRVGQIVKDYSATHVRVLKSKQRNTALRAAAYWLVPPAFIYALGWSVGWIRRGFGNHKGQNYDRGDLRS